MREAVQERAMKDLKAKDTWMVFRIIGEFVEGFDTMRGVGPAVSVFGSARTRPGEAPYEQAVEIGGELAKDGWAVLTGGGPGIMEAACKGAAEAGGKAVGLNIKLPFEEDSNRYANLTVDFDYFFARKVMFIRYSQAYVVLPGGVRDPRRVDRSADADPDQQDRELPRRPRR